MKLGTFVNRSGLFSGDISSRISSTRRFEVCRAN